MDAGFRKRLGHIGHLVTGNAAATAVGLASVILAARALGPTEYGILILVSTFVQAIGRFVSFQTWQPIIRFGAELTADGDPRDMMLLVKFGMVLDLAAGVGGWLIAVICAVGGAAVFGWDPATRLALVLYAFVLLASLNGTPTGVLRLAGRFKSTAYVQSVSGFIRLALSAVAFALDAGLMVYILIWGVTQALNSLILVAILFHELARKHLLGFWRLPYRDVFKRFPGAWRFAWSANLSLTLMSSTQLFDTLIIGGLIDPAAAGYYHIAKRFGRLARQVGQQVQAVIYPEIARLWRSGAVAEFERIVYQTELMLGGVGVALVAVFYFGAEPLLQVAFGQAYLAAAPLVIVQMIAVTMTLSGSAARSALLAMGRETRVLGVVFVSAIAFYASLFALTPMVGAMAGNLSHIVMGAIWLAGMTIFLRRAIRDAADAGAAGTPPAPGQAPDKVPAAMSADFD